MKTGWKSVLIAVCLSMFFPVVSFGADQAPVPSSKTGGPEIAVTPGTSQNGFLNTWVVGIQAGPTFAPQNLVDLRGSTLNLVSGVGPYVSANALYGVSHFATIPLNVLVGLDIDYNSLPVNVQSSSFNLGNSSTVSLLPTVEFRTDKMENLSLYASLGLGVNFNSFSNSSSLNSFCGAVSCSITPSDSFAARLGVGLDYFISPNFALNAEIGYLFNLTNTTLTLSVPGASASGSQNVNLNTLFFLFGFHYRSFI